MARVCSRCGFEVNDKSNFCPNCGFNMLHNDEPKSEKYKFCPRCGCKLKVDTKVCPNCEISFDGRFRKIANKFSDNKTINKILDWGASSSWKSDKNLMSNKFNRKCWEHMDPAFLTVYDSIVGDYLKKLFLLERSKVLVGDSDFFGNLKFTSPTEKWSYDKALKFYEQLLENLIYELNEAKQKDDFDEEEYFKAKFKESKIELFANYPL